ncbi:MAG: hypothetical protein WC353_00605 [Candidatus Peribacter sp.]|jgi:hypothetical protein
MDDTSPATKGDLQKLARSMNEGFALIDERFDRVHEDIDRVLSILVKVKDKTDNHEERIVRLEKAIA